MKLEPISSEGHQLMEAETRAVVLAEALRDIAVYGRTNPGYGYSCATKAIEALNKVGWGASVGE